MLPSKQKTKASLFGADFCAGWPWPCWETIGGQKRKQAEKEAEAEVAKAATNAETKKQHQTRLKQLRRVTGNSLLLSAFLPHNETYFCARLILAVGDLLYQEQTYKSQHKRSPGADALWMCNVAHGAGPSFLKNIWRQNHLYNHG